MFGSSRWACWLLLLGVPLASACGSDNKTDFNDTVPDASAGHDAGGTGASSGTGGVGTGGLGGVPSSGGTSPSGGTGGNGGTGGGQGGGGAGGAPGPCEQVGQKVAVEAARLACTADDSAKVQTDCEANLVAKPFCEDVLRTFVDCALAAPASSWSCNSKGQADLSTCSVEKSALDDCWNTTPCSKPSDCPDPNNPCILQSCVSGKCGTTNATNGTALVNQVPGDCKQAVCDGNGATTTVSDPTDILDDGNACTADTCVAGTPSNTNLPSGSACNPLGHKCDGNGHCVECLLQSDCGTKFCNSAHQCVSPSCNDGATDGNETDVDCGGSCGSTCAPGAVCAAATDCTSGVCTSGRCAAPTCTDGVKNGKETAVDCGGSCSGCGPNQGCQVNADCKGNQCSGASCVANCSDQVMNNGETDVDCGGPNCTKCTNGHKCVLDTDCAGNACIGGVCIDQCGDGIKNGLETAVDCGGPVCRKCALGKPCSATTDCSSGSCADGVCCDLGCTGICSACTAAKKGAGLDGQCGAVLAGTDPHNDCADQGAASCGTNGVCGSSGACAKYPDGTQCAAGSCSGTTQTNPDTCSNGTCKDQGTTSCIPFVCGAASCKTSCASDTDCASGNYCSTGSCLPKKTNGKTCGTTSECTSGFCVDGVCCDQACTGTCVACTATLKGTGVDGTCGNVKAGVATGECTVSGASTCGQDGACDGAGACRLYGSGTSCGTTACLSGSACGSASECWVSSTCNGTGRCVTTTDACDPYVCGGPGQNPPNACGTSCTTDSDCSTQNCNTSTRLCEPKKLDGLSCSAPWQCQSNSCVDGMCCDKPCTNGCEACSAAKKGGGVDGQCGPVAAGSDPHSVCSDASLSGDACGTDGSCDGNGACELRAKDYVCSPQKCDTGPNQQVNASTCDGKGACVANGTLACGDYVCSGSACLSQCATDGDCIAGFYCNAPTCTAQKANGDTCTANDECLGGGCNWLGECTWSTCVNGIKDPSETDVDCGGPDCGATCNTGQACGSVADCAPGNTQCTGTPATCQP